jgi:50S ribosomal subunit-associated GTPase HflX
MGRDELLRLRALHPEALFISAQRERDRAKVIEAMERHLALDAERITVRLDGAREQDRRLLADLYRHAHVVSHVADEDEITVEADVPRRWLPRFQLAKASA